MLTSPAGARFPPHRCRPRYQATQRGLPVPPGADTDIPLVGAGPGGPSKHATTLPIWSLPGPWARQQPHRAPPQEGRGFSIGGRHGGLMPGGRGPQTPRHPSVIRLFSSAGEGHTRNAQQTHGLPQEPASGSLRPCGGHADARHVRTELARQPHTQSPQSPFASLLPRTLPFAASPDARPPRRLHLGACTDRPCVTASRSSTPCTTQQNTRHSN